MASQDGRTIAASRQKDAHRPESRCQSEINSDYEYASVHQAQMHTVPK